MTYYLKPLTCDKLERNFVTRGTVCELSIFRPPDILVGGLRFYRDSIFFFFAR